MSTTKQPPARPVSEHLSPTLTRHSEDVHRANVCEASQCNSWLSRLPFAPSVTQTKP
ncbi:hypothetical protein PGT21_029069 [Puccinia graminis f. sp. tritici]|uniref:Uncharacterized protein n=1 Tax=Puccinia graminis f. sp. tritici TaxID=56615 RepID=A0A5B0RSY8_PUCGR|nr:hypothetical protein PGT21_029069 [Puccinia graminis f. sp. tritici]KAA1128165.1 hypothetical protein PGTUg99_018525 [Puccinia graminis f. sp. tritici]